jgi:hypothetical protein
VYYAIANENPLPKIITLFAKPKAVLDTDTLVNTHELTVTINGMERYTV